MTLLAELFLDTSHDRQDIDALAQRLADLDVDSKTAEALLRDEVAPAFAFNLLNIAGEWAPWDEDEVAQIIAKSRSGAFPAVRRAILRRVGWAMAARDWRKIRASLDRRQQI